jgi:NitT/TauT family transport system substrate-binding protein
MKENAMLRTHRPVAAVALAGAVLATAACGGGDGGDSGGASAGGSGSSGELTELRIAATSVDSLPFMAILQVAADKGWCKDEGLDVSFISGSGGGNTLRTVSTGDADIAITGGPAVVLAQQQSPDALKIIGSWFQVNDFFFIGTDESVADKAKLGVTGAGSTTQLLANYIKQTEMPGVEVVELGGGMGDAWAAARSGSVDAGWAMHPFVTDKVKNEDAKVLITARDVVGDFPADMVAANATYAEENPDALKGFFACAAKANDYVVNDTDKAAEDLSSILGIDAQVVADGLKDTPEMEKAYSLNVDKDALETLSDMLVVNGAIEKPIDWAKTLDQSFLPKDAQADL